MRSLWQFGQPAHYDVGAVNIAATLVAPWERYASCLAPNFVLTAQDALELAIPKTALFQREVLQAIAAKVSAGEAPSTQATPAPEAAAARDSGADLKIDPQLRFASATALLQEVQLLNRQLADAALKRGHHAFLVRVQINVTPFARNLPYDVYANISFFPVREEPASKDKLDPAVPPPRPNWPAYAAYVLPLLVTDNLERAADNQTVAGMHGLDVGAAHGGAQINVGAQFNSMSSGVASGLNSLMTVGRLTDTTIQVRLGALRSANGYAMVPRTHNITAVLMIPEDMLTDDDGQAKPGVPVVRVMASSNFRHAVHGFELPQQTEAQRMKRAEKVLARLNTPKPLRREAADELLHAIFRNDFAGFDAALKRLDTKCTAHATTNNLAREAVFKKKFERDVWSELVETLAYSQYAGARLELPRTNNALLPPDQTVLLLDDGESMNCTLSGGSGLLGMRITASLNGADFSLKALTAEAGADGSTILLRFPSSAAWDLGLAASTAPLSLTIASSPVSAWLSEKATARLQGTQSFAMIRYRAPPASKPASP